MHHTLDKILHKLCRGGKKKSHLREQVTDTFHQQGEQKKKHPNTVQWKLINTGHCQTHKVTVLNTQQDIRPCSELRGAAGGTHIPCADMQ